MLRLKLVKNAGSEVQVRLEENEGLTHGCIVLKDLVRPWFNTQRVVCADSYFSSVSTAEEMGRLGMQFIGVVKTASKRFPQSYLSTLVFQERGNWSGVHHRTETGHEMYAFVWVDRERRYFITNTSSLAHGTPYSRVRMRQIAPVESQLPPERMEYTIQQPKAAEIYYGTCAKIDQHNRRRVDTLSIDRKIETKDWAKRINLSILGMILVDSFLVFQQLIDVNANEGDFYASLAEELIDNNYDSTSLRRRAGRVESPSGPASGPARNGNMGSPDAIGKDGRPRSEIAYSFDSNKAETKGKSSSTTRSLPNLQNENLGNVFILQGHKWHGMLVVSL